MSAGPNSSISQHIRMLALHWRPIRAGWRPIRAGLAGAIAKLALNRAFGGPAGQARERASKRHSWSPDCGRGLQQRVPKRNRACRAEDHLRPGGVRQKACNAQVTTRILHTTGSLTAVVGYQVCREELMHRNQASKAVEAEPVSTLEARRRRSQKHT